MRRGLYLLFEGLPGTVIDSQVLLHARDMREQGIVDFEIWAVAGGARRYRDSRARLDEATRRSRSQVRLFHGLRPGLPGSIEGNARRVAHWLDVLQPSFDLLHARTDYAAAVGGLLKPGRGFQLLWDCRGDGEAEFAARYGGRGLLHAVLRTYFIRACRERVRLAAAGCDRAVFVSRHLETRLAAGIEGKPREIIPCAASGTLFFYGERLRTETRARLGYSDRDSVLVYCGGLTGYQCFPESLEVFRSLHSRDFHWKFLVVTPDRNAAEHALRPSERESCRVVSAPIEGVNAFLNAADYALLLRRKDPLNAAASPTKFAEYGLAGLPVLMEDTIPDAYALAREVGNLCPCQGSHVVFPAMPDRPTISAAYRERLSRTAMQDRYRRLYSPGNPSRL